MRYFLQLVVTFVFLASCPIFGSAAELVFAPVSLEGCEKAVELPAVATADNMARKSGPGRGYFWFGRDVALGDAFAVSQPSRLSIEYRCFKFKGGRAALAKQFEKYEAYCANPETGGGVVTHTCKPSLTDDVFAVLAEMKLSDPLKTADGAILNFLTTITAYGLNGSIVVSVSAMEPLKDLSVKRLNEAVSRALVVR